MDGELRWVDLHHAGEMLEGAAAAAGGGGGGGGRAGNVAAIDAGILARSMLGSGDLAVPLPTRVADALAGYEPRNPDAVKRLAATVWDCRAAGL